MTLAYTFSRHITGPIRRWNTVVTSRRHFVSAAIALLVAILLFTFMMPSVAMADAIDANISGIGVASIVEAAANNNSSSDSHYMDINMNIMAASNSFLSGGATIIQSLTTTLLLPLGLLVAAWRVIYIAVFPLMTKTDPLNMLDSARFSGERSGFGGRGDGGPGPRHGKLIMKGDDMSARASQLLRQETKRFLFYAFIIFAVWAILQIIMWFVVLLVSIF